MKYSTEIAAALLLSRTFVQAVPTQKRASLPSNVMSTQWDYIICGGGLAGSVLASRLSEDSSVNVLLLEAGTNEEGNSGVFDATSYQSTFGTSVDWAYQTTQQLIGGSAITMRSGKGLGGSTLINGLAWTKPHSFQIDALETLGNDGLNWDSLQPYMLMAESATGPSNSYLTWNSACHGESGFVETEYDPTVSPAAMEIAMNTTVQNLGLPYAGDLTCGSPAGAGPVQNTRYNATSTLARRSDAFWAYLNADGNGVAPIARTNLQVLPETVAGKVILSNSSSLAATGVEFQFSDGNVYSVSCRKEVIMAAGALKTPAILQFSGIGPAKALSDAGITQRLESPIGQNLIDQTTTTTDFTFNITRGGGQVVLFPRYKDLFSGQDLATYNAMLVNGTESWAEDAVINQAFTNQTALKRILDMQSDWILNKEAAIAESFDYTYSNVLGYDSWFLLPYSRGSVQVTSNSPYAGNNININPRYLSATIDLTAQALVSKWTRTVSNTAPLNAGVSGETTPGSSVGDTTEDWSNWVEKNYRSNWHPIGTAAMMSQEFGGAVDTRYRLYGVSNLRVVDASVLPVQVSSHLMTVLYGLAERAAAFIKEDASSITSPGNSSSATASSGAATATPVVSGSMKQSVVPATTITSGSRTITQGASTVMVSVLASGSAAPANIAASSSTQISAANNLVVPISSLAFLASIIVFIA